MLALRESCRGVKPKPPKITAREPSPRKGGRGGFVVIARLKRRSKFEDAYMVAAGTGGRRTKAAPQT